MRATSITTRGAVIVNCPSATESTANNGRTGTTIAPRKMHHDSSVPAWLSSWILRRPYVSDQRPRIGAPTSWHTEYVAPMTP